MSLHLRQNSTVEFQPRCSLANIAVASATNSGLLSQMPGKVCYVSWSCNDPSFLQNPKYFYIWFILERGVNILIIFVWAACSYLPGSSTRDVTVPEFLISIQCIKKRILHTSFDIRAKQDPNPWSKLYDWTAYGQFEKMWPVCYSDQ